LANIYLDALDKELDQRGHCYCRYADDCNIYVGSEAAAERTLAALTDLVNQAEPGDRFRFTAALANGRDLYAFRYAVNDRANTLYYRESERGIVVVSEPLDEDHKNWIAVPENHVVVACAGERARILPLLHRHQEAAE